MFAPPQPEEAAQQVEAPAEPQAPQAPEVCLGIT